MSENYEGCHHCGCQSQEHKLPRWRLMVTYTTRDGAVGMGWANKYGMRSVKYEPYDPPDTNISYVVEMDDFSGTVQL